MQYSARQLNRATLQRQLLLGRESVGAVGAVDRVFAMQAQEPASPYLALWNRVAGFDATDLDRAFAERTIVKSTLMRVTLHAVTAADQPILHAAMRRRLRQSRLNDKRFRGLGLTPDHADAALTALAEILAEPRTNAELDTALRERFGDLPAPGLWWALRTFAPLHHAPTGAPWTFGPRPSYVAAPPAVAVDDDTAVQHFVLRYLEAFGPASILDIAQFSLLLRPTVRQAVASLDLETVTGPDGVELLDVPGREPGGDDVDAPPRLMAMWDSVLLAYADRSRIIPPDYRAHVIRNNGDVLATVLVDGRVAGVWRPAPDGIEITAFHRLPRDVWRALGDEARGLRDFLADRDPEVYRRYVRWWSSLPDAEVRTL